MAQQTNSQPVDVLAVMERAAYWCGVEVEEARAIVAELVEASKRVDAALMAWRMSGKPDLGELNAAQGDLNRALARVQGGA